MRYSKIQKQVPLFIIIKVLCFSTSYMSSIIGSSQVSECFYHYKYNHIQPPDAAAFRHVDLIISSVRYFIMKIMHSLLEV